MPSSHTHTDTQSCHHPANAAPTRDSNRDPVCGMVVTPNAAKGGSLTYEGETLHFCGAQCKARFEASPSTYCGEAEVASPQKNAIDTDGYTCPMHPDITQHGPGACPLCGMSLEPVDGANRGDEELHMMQRRLLSAALFALPLVPFSMFKQNPMHQIIMLPVGILQWMLASPAVVYGGWPLWRLGVASFTQRRLNMFSLIFLGVGAAYTFSIIVTLWPDFFRGFAAQRHQPLYFESAAAITVLALLGQVLELRARRQTSTAIGSLIQLVPSMAHRLDNDGAEHDVPFADVRVNDMLRVKPGELVPVDGTIVIGTTRIDESMLTGEPEPVARSVDDSIAGGTLNQTGVVTMRAMRVGESALLARIVRHIREAQRSRAPIARIADVVSAIFVPAVVAIAVVTFAAWFYLGPAPRFSTALVNAISVLVTACPCALGLATPMSMMVGVGVAARKGILIRDAEALEILHKVDTLILDKTGTITEGRPSVTRLEAIGTADEATVLFLAASLESVSEHPIALGVIDAARKRKLKLIDPTQFEAYPGEGVTGHLEGASVAVGTAPFMRRLGIAIPSHAHPILIAHRGQVIGSLQVADAVKPHSAQAIAQLQAMGLRIVMLTGDSLSNATAVAAQLGLSEVVAEMLPNDKVAAVENLIHEGHIIAMAGDGINDGPALAGAHVGIAMGTGSEVAIETASVTLVRGDLRVIYDAIVLSRATMRNIKQNLAFAFGYNFLGVPIAAGILYPAFGMLLNPMWAGAAMAASSVSVIINALRLRKALPQ